MGIKEFLNQIHNVPGEVMDRYLEQWKPFSLPKKQIMTAPEEVERFMYFVKRGVQKSYYLKEGKQHIIAFTYPPSFTGIPESFFTQSASKYFLETISDSEFLRISFEQHHRFMIAHREIETLFRKGTEMLLAGVLERQYELMALDIESRYKLFVRRSPHLLHLVPQKDLASYLRIDPTNFSKLYNKIKI